MSENAGKTIKAGGLEFIVENRSFGGDGGPAVMIYGQTGHPETVVKQTQLLRFDCFARDPHYHLDPDGANVVFHLNPLSGVVSWSVDFIERNLPTLIKLAGYPETAERIDMDAVKEALPELCVALVAAAPGCSPDEEATKQSEFTRKMAEKL